MAAFVLLLPLIFIATINSECLHEGVIQHGSYRTIEGPDLNTGQRTVEVLCNAGYDLNGQSQNRLCDITDEWIDSEPICVDVDECGDDNSYYYNSESDQAYFEYPCHELAFCRNTQGSFICFCPPGYQGDGITSCERHSCPDLEAPPHGTVRIVNNLRAYFTCEEEYTLYGSNLRVCRHGNWTGRQPFCQIMIVGCGDPGEIENGQKHGTLYDIDNFVRYVCNEGYERVGPSRRDCLPNGYWSGYQPHCKLPSDLNDIASTIRQEFIDKFEFYTVSSQGHRSLGRLSVGGSLGLDLVFAFDCSSSIDPVDFNRGMIFSRHIVREFGVSYEPGGTRVAAISFASVATLEFNLGDDIVNTTEKAIEQLQVIQASGGGTAMKEAFEIMFSEVVPRLRPESKKAMFIITDGKSNSGSPISYAQRLRDRNEHAFEIFAIGIGNGVDRNELKKIASEPFTSHVFLIRQYEDLTTLTDIISEKRTNYTRCGIAGNIEVQPGNARIVGGDEANPGAWPWTVALYQNHKTRNTIFVCGGTLICKNWVMTAAHCLERRGRLLPPAKLFVRLGEHERAKDEGFEQTIPIADYIVHPNYNGETYDYNIALLKLEEPAQLVSYVQTLCLPNEDDLFIARPNTYNCYVAGWGASNQAESNVDAGNPSLVLGQIQLPIIATQTCRETTHRVITDRMLCAGYRFKPRDACREDSGGALMCRRNDDTFTAIGVVSWGEGCGELNNYGIYTNVLKFVDWINENTESCNTIHQRPNENIAQEEEK
ncbi:uncharacterized protein LOC100368814 [Saccoglossus kowalevskii]|uniref:C3/C5 convertase n=1 Tax=Saccoglossus kowalevskii TaxID=10224 RepID=A0ABM0N1C4_SACKO|nr:PREDICTED: complement C2-like [Saccoglossus kowalevskii]